MRSDHHLTAAPPRCLRAAYTWRSRTRARSSFGSVQVVLEDRREVEEAVRQLLKATLASEKPPDEPVAGS
jgi:hypothetical protein